MIEYKDKDVDKVINRDITEQFKQDDSNRSRDDQEIYEAAKKVIAKYINEIKADPSQKYDPEVLKPFTTLQEQFHSEREKLDTLRRYKFRTDNKNLINTLANKIDNAEELVLERLAMNRATKEVKEAENKQQSDVKFFTTSDKGEMLLTAATNKPKIQEVLGNLFNNTQKNFLIDYSGCTNARIKSNMINKIGTDKCWISYDQTTQTYQLKDSEGHTLPSRALIWEGVKLAPEEIVSIQAKQAIQKQLDERTNKLLNKEVTDTERDELVKLVPANLRAKLNTKGLMPDFLKKTDKRI
ncbi:MAG: hypothetical protein LBG52_03655 [Candidatus Peribacteria bacterium]|jgi:hypothetical protein|nr:hypothetical protein [Candidatus Peribacteria bacterium]